MEGRVRMLNQTPSARRQCLRLAAACALVFLAPSAEAQFLGHNFPGDYGLKSATQPPAGRYAGLLVPFYKTDTLKLERVELGGRTDDDLTVWGLAPLVYVVTDKTILGGNYGFIAAVAFTNTSLEVPRLDVDQDQFGFSDIYVVPFQLGWHGDRYDAIASYGFFAPTGRYEANADDNLGLGMWSHEFAAGFTGYLDEARSWSVATTAFYEIHTKKDGVDIRAGDWLILEGGVGKTFENASSVGLAYYAIWQTTDASGADVPELLRGRRNRGFGLGPELQLLQGGLVVRALWEFGVQNNLEGFIATATLVVPF